MHRDAIKVLKTHSVHIEVHLSRCIFSLIVLENRFNSTSKQYESELKDLETPENVVIRILS